MLTCKTILVPFDFSPFSREALKLGLNLARRTGAEIHVLHVETMHTNPLVNSASAPVKSEVLRERVEASFDDFEGLSSGVVVYCAVGRDILPGPSILDYARMYEADLIVMGTHGRRGFRRFLLGSVAEEIVRQSHCPVLTVPRSTDGDATLRRILVPTDFSHHAKEALSYAKELAQLFDAQIDMFHAVNVPAQVTFYDTGLFSVYEYQPELEEYAEDKLKAFYTNSEGPDVERVTFTVTYEPEAESISRFAEESDCDLVVMGTHGRTGMDRFLMGSVTTNTIRRIETPVLIVKSFGKSLIDDRAARVEETVSAA